MYSLLPRANGRGPNPQLQLNVRASWVAGAPVHGDALLTLCRPSQEAIEHDLGYGGRSSSARLSIRWRSFTAADFWCCAQDLVAGMDFPKARHAPYVTMLPEKYISPTAWFGPSPKQMLQQYNKRQASWWGHLPPLHTSDPSLYPSLSPHVPPSGQQLELAGPHQVLPSALVPHAVTRVMDVTVPPVGPTSATAAAAAAVPALSDIDVPDVDAAAPSDIDVPDVDAAAPLDIAAPGVPVLAPPPPAPISAPTATPMQPTTTQPSLTPSAASPSPLAITSTTHTNTPTSNRDLQPENPASAISDSLTASECLDPVAATALSDLVAASAASATAAALNAPSSSAIAPMGLAAGGAAASAVAAVESLHAARMQAAGASAATLSAQTRASAQALRQDLQALATAAACFAAAVAPAVASELVSRSESSDAAAADPSHALSTPPYRKGEATAAAAGGAAGEAQERPSAAAGAIPSTPAAAAPSMDMDECGVACAAAISATLAASGMVDLLRNLQHPAPPTGRKQEPAGHTLPLTWSAAPIPAAADSATAPVPSFPGLARAQGVTAAVQPPIAVAAAQGVPAAAPVPSFPGLAGAQGVTAAAQPPHAVAAVSKACHELLAGNGEGHPLQSLQSLLSIGLAAASQGSIVSAAAGAAEGSVEASTPTPRVQEAGAPSVRLSLAEARRTQARIAEAAQAVEVALPAALDLAAAMGAGVTATALRRQQQRQQQPPQGGDGQQLQLQVNVPIQQQDQQQQQEQQHVVLPYVDVLQLEASVLPSSVVAAAHEGERAAWATSPSPLHTLPPQQAQSHPAAPAPTSVPAAPVASAEAQGSTTSRLLARALNASVSAASHASPDFNATAPGVAAAILALSPSSAAALPAGGTSPVPAAAAAAAPQAREAAAQAMPETTAAAPASRHLEAHQVSAPARGPAADHGASAASKTAVPRPEVAMSGTPQPSTTPALPSPHVLPTQPPGTRIAQPSATPALPSLHFLPIQPLHPLLVALASHLTVIPQEPVYSTRMVDAERPQLNIVTVNAQGFGGRIFVAESEVCDHEEIGQQQAALSVLQQLQHHDLHLFMPLHNEEQMKEVRAQCIAELAEALRRSASHVALHPGIEALPSAAPAAPAGAPTSPMIEVEHPSGGSTDSAEQARQKGAGMRDGMVVKISYHLSLEQDCFFQGYPSTDHLLEQNHINITLGCRMIQPKMEAAVRMLQPGESAFIRPFFVSQSGRQLLKITASAGQGQSEEPQCLFPPLPATLKVTLDAPPHVPPSPQLPRRALQQPLFEGNGSPLVFGGASGALQQQRVEAALHNLRQGVPGTPSGAAHTLLDIGCDQGHLIEALLAVYVPALSTVGPPLELIIGICQSSKDLASLHERLQPFLKPFQCEAGSSPKPSTAGNAAQLTQANITSPSSGAGAQVIQEHSRGGSCPSLDAASHAAASAAHRLAHPHLHLPSLLSLRQQAHRLESEDAVAVHFHRPNAFARVDQADVTAMQVGTPSVALLQRDTLSPSMANTESWGGLAHCHAVTALEVLQRLDVQELGAFGHCILGALRPKCLILTTPNWDYNKVMRAAMAIRCTPSGSPSDDLEAGEGGFQGWGSTFHYPTNATRAVQPASGASEQPGPSTRPGAAAAHPADMSSQVEAPAAGNATQPPSTGATAAGAARNTAAPNSRGAVGRVGGASLTDAGPAWPGPAGRDGLPLRHSDHKFEWTRQEFRSWAQDLAERFGYKVRFEEIGHVVNEAQVLQAMPAMGKDQPGEPEAQGATAGRLPEVDIQLASSKPDVGAPAPGTFEAVIKQPGLAAELLGQEQLEGKQHDAEQGAGGGKKETLPDFGGATQMAIFTLEDGEASLGMSAGKLKEMLQQTEWVGLLSKALLWTTQQGPAQAKKGTGLSPLSGEQVVNAAGQTAFDDISMAGSTEESI